MNKLNIINSIDLNANAPNPWELIDGVSILNVVNEVGGGTG